MIKKFLSEQSGRTMIEAIGYISIMITITVALTTAVNTGYNRFRLGRVNQQVVDLNKVISQRYVASENYQDVKIETLIEEKIIPHEVRDGKHAFGGTITIGKGDEAGNTYFIEFADLPNQACVELGSKLWIVNSGSDLYALTINDSSTWAWKYSNYKDNIDKELPAKPTDVADVCNSSSNNKIKWYFN